MEHSWTTYNNLVRIALGSNIVNNDYGAPWNATMNTIDARLHDDSLYRQAISGVSGVIECNGLGVFSENTDNVPELLFEKQLDSSRYYIANAVGATALDTTSALLVGDAILVPFFHIGASGSYAVNVYVTVGSANFKYAVYDDNLVKLHEGTTSGGTGLVAFSGTADIFHGQKLYLAIMADQQVTFRGVNLGSAFSIGGLLDSAGSDFGTHISKTLSYSSQFPTLWSEWQIGSLTDTYGASVCYGNAMFIGAASTGIIKSIDAKNWTVISTGGWTYIGIVYGAGIFVALTAANSFRVSYSSDGDIWTTQEVFDRYHFWTGICYGNSLFVAVAYNANDGNQVMTSHNGKKWVLRATPSINEWRAVCWGNGLFVAVSSTGTGNRVMTSPDGITWTLRASAADNYWRSVCWGNGLFVAVASTGTGNRVMTSPDGITWTIRSSAADNNWRSVCWGNGLFVAVASTGTGNRVMTSPDGITWTLRASAADNEWRSVCWGNGLFVALSATGADNRVMTWGGQPNFAGDIVGGVPPAVLVL